MRVEVIRVLAVSAVLAGAGCVDLVGADSNKIVERDEKHYSTSGTPEIVLSTFDGSIEVRAWDKPEVDVTIEKHASSKELADSIQVTAEQTGNRIIVDAKAPDTHGFG